jgi:predicted nucleic acid-binding protein
MAFDTRELREKRHKLLAEARAVLEKADAEKRATTAEERSQYDKIWNETESLKTEIADHERRNDIEREELAERYAAVLTDPACFRLVDLTPGIAIGAARLRARYGLRLPDAVQLSTALQAGAVALVTHDRDFAGCTDLPILSAQP